MSLRVCFGTGRVPAGGNCAEQETDLGDRLTLTRPLSRFSMKRAKSMSVLSNSEVSTQLLFDISGTGPKSIVLERMAF